MKIAISATGTELSSQVDPRFGRAPYLLIVETENNALVQVIDNRAAAEAMQGAGINAASRIAEAGAQAILTGVVGPKAAAVCEQAGIRMHNGASGTVAEAVQRFITDTDATAVPQPPAATGATNAGQGRGSDCRRQGGGGRRQGGGCRQRQGQGQGRG
ncbi:MAG: hypothetical protein BWK76_21235 [Desulfobulbaceae bacterium A2]|nr:MAG: hypothetical protein BWK76_21235 [Desulfobulbaceae bacterium A2]